MTGSLDGFVCLWSLDDWSLLNQIDNSDGVMHVTLSRDDVFLLTLTENGIPRLHSLTTGSLLRIWTGLSSKVSD